MRLGFLGTPQFAVPVLEALAGEHEVRLVVSRPDRRRGRRGHAEPSPVKAAAQRLGLLTSERVRDLLEWELELAIVVAFGRIIKPEVLDRVPMVNLHLSLLPRWRGAAPVQRAILAGDPITGVCLMSLEEGLDTGPVHACEETAIGEDETASQLTERLVSLGTPMLLDQLGRELGPGTPQAGNPTYAEKITTDDVRLDWSLPATDLHRRVRVGGAWCLFRDQRFGVTESEVSDDDLASPGEIVRRDGRLLVGTGRGALVLKRVKPEGRREVAAADWANGARLESEDQMR